MWRSAVWFQPGKFERNRRAHFRAYAPGAPDIKNGALGRRFGFHDRLAVADSRSGGCVHFSFFHAAVFVDLERFGAPLDDFAIDDDFGNALHRRQLEHRIKENPLHD